MCVGASRGTSNNAGVVVIDIVASRRGRRLGDFLLSGRLNERWRVNIRYCL